MRRAGGNLSESRAEPTTLRLDGEARIVLTTVANEADARRLAKLLVEGGFAACVSIVPLRASVYRWQGTIVEEAEQLLVVKTTTAALAGLASALVAAHPYELPEVLILEASASAAYAEWIAASIGPRS